MKAAAAAHLAAEKLEEALSRLDTLSQQLEGQMRDAAGTASGPLTDAANLLGAVHEQVGSDTADRLAGQVRSQIDKTATLASGLAAVDARTEEVINAVNQYKADIAALVLQLRA